MNHRNIAAQFRIERLTDLDSAPMRRLMADAVRHAGPEDEPSDLEDDADNTPPCGAD